MESRRVIATALAIGLVALLGFYGAAKLLRAGFEVAAFQRWGYPSAFRVMVGSFEVACAVALLVPAARWWAALAVLPLMAGAMMTNITHAELDKLGLPIGTALAALALLLLTPMPARVGAWTARLRA